MSKVRTQNGDDYPEAAGKNLEDARVLLAGKRDDGAAYHAGYVVECALKTIAIVEGRRPWGHDLSNLSGEALRLASVAGAKTARYVPRMTPGHRLYDRAAGWNESLRYRAPLAVTRADSLEWVAEARSVYESTVVPMLLDGVI